jgi:hypothetical protein
MQQMPAVIIQLLSHKQSRQQILMHRQLEQFLQTRRSIAQQHLHLRRQQQPMIAVAQQSIY